MKSFPSFKNYILFKSTIALAVYPLLLSFLNVRAFFQEGNDHFHHNDLENPKNLPASLQENHASGNFFTNQQLIGSLSLSYFAFLLVGLAIDGILKVIFNFLENLKGDRGQVLQGSNWRREMMGTVIIYTAIYCFCQILAGGGFSLFMITTGSSAFITSSKQLFPFQPHRLLEEIEPINDEYESPERISLSLGKVLSSLNIQANHMVVTKDMKYAFATVYMTGALKVIDISNLAAPNVIETLAVAYHTNFSKQRFLYLSSDEKTLFVSCYETLEIIDISNPGCVSSLTIVPDEKFINTMQSHFEIRLSLSFALSADSKTLFIGGLGLQTFDISDLENPVLLNSQLTVPKTRSYFLLTIAATADRKTLWVANGTLDSYDISDARNMRPIKSFSDAEISMNSIILSRDNKTAFGLGMIGTEKIQITTVDISNAVSPLKIKSVVFPQVSLRPAFIMALSQKERFLFIATDQGTIDYQTVVFDLVESQVLKDDQSLLAKIKTVATLPRENFILASGSLKTVLIEFYKNIPNKEIFSLTDYPMWTIEMTMKYNNIDFSQDGNYLFVASHENSTSQSLLEIYDFKNKTHPDLLSSLELGSEIYHIAVSPDLRRAGLVAKNKVLFFDISNMAAPSHHSEYKSEGYSDIEQITFWAGSDIAFVLVNTFHAIGNTAEIKLIDFSDPKSSKEIYKLALPVGEEQNYKMSVYQERSLLFVTGPNLLIYDISDINNPSKMGSIEVNLEETEYTHFAKASHDFKTFFVETFDRSSFHKLRIYDISDLEKPKFVSELILPMDTTQTPLLTGDSKTIYLLQEKDIMMIDVSNIRIPRIFGLLPINDVYQEGIIQTKLSGDSRTIYLVTKSGTMHSMALQVPATLYLDQEEFHIGKHYSGVPLMLKLDRGSAYKLVRDNEYKISRVGIFEVKVDATADYATPSMAVLPSWASFDQANKILTIEPRKQDNLGYYTLFASISKKVSASAFSFYDSNRTNSLLTDLMLLGYLDKQQFLISDIGLLEEFRLPNSYEDQKKSIFEVLNEYYVITCTTINILPSLRVVQEKDKLSISSPNNDYVKVNIQLHNTTHAKFVKKYYDSLKPVITSGKSHLMIEGPLKKVNAILKNLTVDLDGIKTCSAEITVIDEMNPSVTVSLGDINRFFRINQAPYVNEKPKKSVQRQIDTVPVYTGQYFTITLDSDTILDENSDDLNYKLISKGGEANDTIPSWLTFDGLTMRGTAPEVLFDREIEFILVASNEFKKIEVSFRIHLKISSTYIAKLIMKYSPYILTIIGLYIKANKIYNILGKKIYRHKKDFYVGIGEEITNEVIFPIAFIQEETKESEIIWEYLKKRELRNRVDGIADKGKILNLIKETVDNDIPKQIKKTLILSLCGADSRKKIINQLLINKLVYLQLNLKEEKPTKRAYEKVKDQWPELVEWDLKSDSFKTNLNKLYAILTEHEETTSLGDLEESLLHNSKKLGVNIHLLSVALEAYTFHCHSIKTLAIRSNIQIKEKTKKNCVQSFLKFDIETMNSNSQLQVNYGITCKFENDSLVFSGVPCDNFKKKTLVIEIANRGHKTLKEIWIHEKSVSCASSIENNSEVIEAQEQNYEVL